MAISYPISMPLRADGTTIIQSYDLRMVEKIGVSESPFSYKQQFQDYNSMRWELDIKTVPLYGEDALNVRGFLQSLRGQLGRFYVSIPQLLANQYEMASAAFTNDMELDVRLISSGFSHRFKRGTYFSMANRLYMATTDLSSLGGNGSVDITPKLRDNRNANDPIYTYNPIGVFRLNSNDPNVSVDVTEGHSMTISCHEAI